MHYSINTEEIKTENEKLEYTITNIWNFKQCTTMLPLSMFFVELKPALINKICSTNSQVNYLCSQLIESLLYTI
jgi:hypothetical protein